VKGLERYARVLNAAEINSSFYRPHARATYERWASRVPESFRFSVKMPKTITHEQRLSGVRGQLDQFLAEAGGLGGKLGAKSRVCGRTYASKTCPRRIIGLEQSWTDMTRIQ